MIHVYCNKRGSGKTKALIGMANEKVSNARGNVVYIDDDSRPMLELDRKIRFLTTKEFNLSDYDSFYGFLCGILSEDYDIEHIFIDGLSNIIGKDLKDAAHLFSNLEKMTQEKGIELYINANLESVEMPDFIRKYVA